MSRRQATFRLVKIDAKAGAGGEDQIVFVVANYGKTNPTKLNDKAIGPVGREYGELGVFVLVHSRILVG